MFRKCVCFALFSLATTHILVSDAKASVKLVVMFDRGMCSVPAPSDSSHSLQTIAVPSDILEAMEAAGVSSIASSFPDFQPPDTLVAMRSGELVRVGDLSRVFYLECPNEEQATSLISSLGALPGVVYITRTDEAIKLACDNNAVTDPYYTGQNPGSYIQWNLNNCGAANYLGVPLTQDADMDIPEAWSITQGSNETVFLFDTPVEGTYNTVTPNDLAGRIGGDTVGYPIDDPNWVHGYNMASIIVGNSNNGIGGTGINRLANVESSAVKDLPDGYPYESAIRRAVNAALNSPSNSEIINMSYTNENPRTFTLEPELLALRDAYNAGFLLVAAAGNESSENPMRAWPAAYDFVMGVGSSNTLDGKFTFSSAGDWVDVVAPGQFILKYVDGQGYAVTTGGNTSASAAEVSGVASLLLAQNPELGGEDLRRLIQHSTDNFTGGQRTDGMGWGRVNAYNALKQLMPPNKFFRRSGIGGTTYAAVTRTDQKFKDVAGVTSNQNYYVRRHEVRRDVTYPVAYNQVPYVYGRGAGTNGFTGSNPEYGVEFCGVVSGSQTRYGCTLYTYVYEVLNPFGGTVGWIPKQPNQVQFSYSVIGLDRGPRIRSYARAQGNTVLAAMPGTAAVGCPHGDGGAIVIAC